MGPRGGGRGSNSSPPSPFPPRIEGVMRTSEFTDPELGLTSRHLTLIAAACEEASARWEAQATSTPDPKLSDHLRRQATLAKEVAALADHITFEWVLDSDADPLDWDGPGPIGQLAYGCIAHRAGIQVASLWGIWDPTPEYRLEVEAELLLEAK